MPYRTKILLSLLALVSICVLAYWQGLKGPFLLDDYNNLKPLLALKEDPNSNFTEVVSSNQSGPLGRAIPVTTFALSYLAFGMDAWILKFTNLIIHIVCGCLVFWLVYLLISHSELREKKLPLALAVAALWLFSPMLLSTVLYIVQRMAQLAALFSIATCISYVYARFALINSKFIRAYALLATAVLVFAPLAVFSKENALLLPLFLFIIEICFFRFQAAAFHSRILKFSYVCILLLPGLGAAVYLLLTFDPQSRFFKEEFTFVERVLTQPRVLFLYVKSLLIPDIRTIGLYHDDIELSTGLATPITTLLSIVGWLGLLSSSVWAYRFPQWRPAVGGLWFFLAGHTLESSIFPLDIYYEHRNYLPAVGLYLGFVSATYILLRNRISPPLFIGLAVVYVLLFTSLTAHKAYTWSDWKIRVYMNALNHPDSVNANRELVVLYTQLGQLTPALQTLEKVQELEPESSMAIALQRFQIYCTLEASAPASAYQHFADTLKPRKLLYLDTVLRKLNNDYAETNCPTIDYNRLMSILHNWMINTYLNEPEIARRFSDRYYWNPIFRTAQGLHLAHETGKAIKLLEAAHDKGARVPELTLLLARMHLDNANPDNAAEVLQLFETRYPDDIERLKSIYQSTRDRLHRTIPTQPDTTP